MSAPLSPANTSACCVSPCVDQSVTNIPGPKGDNGSNGTNGTNGQNAWTLSTAAFVVPAVGASVIVTVQNSDWIGNGQEVYVTVAGYYEVVGLPSSTQVTIKNLGEIGNAAPATNIPAPQKISPAGLKGLDGAAAVTTFNQLSPTTTRGDIIVDDGANTPAASDVRVGAGTNGQALVADSTQPAGLKYSSITPNATTDNGIPRYDGTTGTPVPLQTSKVVITDDGAIQASGSGGNARGSDATDLQVTRGANTQVASGANSALVGGVSNTASAGNSGVLCGSGNIASGASSAIAGGVTNTASSPKTFVGGGDFNVASNTNAGVSSGTTNTASGPNSAVAGGSNNTASSGSTAVGGGTNNTASATQSFVPGGSNGVADKFGQMAHGSGSFSTAGDAQTSELLWRIGTSDNTAGVEAFLDGSTQRATIATNTTWAFYILTTVRTSAGVSVVLETKGGIQNNAGTVSLVGANTQAVLVDGSGGTITTANLVIDADNTDKALRVKVTGLVATNIRWLSCAKIVEITF